MIVTIKPKNGKPIKKKFSDPKEAIAWINSTTAELAAQQGVQPTRDSVAEKEPIPTKHPVKIARG